MEIPRFWRLHDHMYRLVGSNCQECHKVHLPAKRICPDCGHDNLEPVQSKINEAQPEIKASEPANT